MFPFMENETIVQTILIHLMTSVRFLGVFVTSPLFMLATIPNPVRYWLSFILALIVTPLVNNAIPTVLVGNWISVFIMGGREFLIGASIGIVSSLPIHAMQISGFMEGTFIGLNMMNMFDPLSREQMSVLAQMKNLLAIWFYFHWDGHLLLIQALSESARLLPIGLGDWGAAGDIPWSDWVQRAFVMAFKISLPVFASTMLAQIGLGFVARTVPQMNVFVLGIPLKIAIGFIVLVMVLPTSVDLMYPEIERAVEWALMGIHFWR